ncbi:PAS domain-containing protein [Novispirillum sp. DQ9]|uniref:PAS domain-containing sensor histidine kinase n=1 Tax=Novispirillum sp. DQ9 TaxID=3398612 RepID=UPI003C7AFCE3
MAMPLVVLDPAGRAAEANSAFLALAHLAGGRLDGFVPSALFVTHPDGTVEPLADVLARPNAPRRGEACLRRGDGRVLDVSFTAASFSDGDRLLTAVTVADVTAEKCLNCKIHISREKYRAVVDAQPELLCRMLPDTTVTFANDAFAATLGRLPHEIVGSRLDDLLGAEATAALRDWLAALRPEDFLSDGPMDLRLPGREGRPTWWSRRAIFEPGGALLAAQIVGREGGRDGEAPRGSASAPSQADLIARMRDSEDRHRTIVSALEEGVILVDRAGTILQTNSAARRILRLSGDLVGRALSAVLDAPVIDRDGGVMGRRDLPLSVALRTGHAVEGTLLGIAAPDGVTWLRTNAQTILLPGHAGACGLLSFTDVTELVRMQDALTESKRHLRGILDHTFEFIGLLDAHGTVIDINRTALDFIGASIEDVRGRPFWETPWWSHDAAEQARLREAINQVREGAFVRYEVAHHTPDGQPITVDFSLNPVVDADGQVELLIPEGRDITERKAAERRLEQARLEAEAANATKTQFLANMSHELRTPLNAVLGYTEAILAEMFGPLENPRYREYLGIIHASGRHLQDIIGDILEISRIELGELELVPEDADLPTLVREAEALLATRAAHGAVDVRASVDPAVPTWRCDRRRLLQVLLNLGSNGIKFTPPGGTVSIDLRGEDGGGALLLTVADTGIGIPADHQEMVWRSFRQVANAMTRGHDGLGLGLPIVKALVEAHGGTIGLTSAPGQGTTVTARLPRM